VISSLLHTWSNGKWYLFSYYIDLYDGARNLYHLQKEYSDRIHVVNYENITQEPEVYMRKILTFLELEYHAGIVAALDKNSVKGRMGDPTGVNQYDVVSSDPLNKWMMHIRNPVRKQWCRKYLNWLGQEQLSQMGYDLHILQKELDIVPTNMKYFWTDVRGLTYGRVRNAIQDRLLR